MTIHNEAKKEEIAKIVIMPGDPLRAKYIAENFLEDWKLVNKVRNMFAFTGNYKGKKLTIMGSGMGMPSMGIYSYELYKFYDVDYIIRIGSCGSYSETLNLLDVILVNESYTPGKFAENMTGQDCNIVKSSKSLNNLILKTAEEQNILCKESDTVCTECFDAYMTNPEKFIEKLPKNINCAEMESFALFYTAKTLNKKAGCLLTVVDSIFKKENLPTEAREKSLNNMIKLSLESAIQLEN